MKRGIIYGLIAAGLLALWFVMRGHDRRVDQSIAAPVLGQDDKAKIIIDQNRHVFTRIERDSKTGRETVVRSYLNPHGPVSIVEKKDGKEILIQRTWGTELSPFVGGSFGSDFKIRAALGLDIFYVQRWELGGGLLMSSDIHDTRIFAHVSYNAYGNMFIAGGIDNRKTAQLIAGLKF